MLAHDAVLLDPLDEGIARSVVRDREPEGVRRLDDLHLFSLAYRGGGTMLLWPTG